MCGGCIFQRGVYNNPNVNMQDNLRLGGLCQSANKDGDEEAASFRPLPPPYTSASNSHLFSDHLLHARRAIEVPGLPYNGSFLSHPPTEEEQEQEAKKSKITRFQLKAKCID